MTIGPEPRMSTLVGFSVTLSLSSRVGHRPLPTQRHVEGVSGLSPLSEIGEGGAVAGGEVEYEHFRGLLGHAKPLVSCWPPTSPHAASRRRRLRLAPPLRNRRGGSGSKGRGG